MTNNPILHQSDGVTLKEYVDLRFAEAQRALDKAEATMSNRLAGMNEFREQLKDQAAHFVTRSEAEAKHEAMCRDIDDLKSMADIAKGKASQTSVMLTLGLALLGLLMSVVLHFVK